VGCQSAASLSKLVVRDELSAVNTNLSFQRLNEIALEVVRVLSGNRERWIGN